MMGDSQARSGRNSSSGRGGGDVIVFNGRPAVNSLVDDDEACVRCSLLRRAQPPTFTAPAHINIFPIAISHRYFALNIVDYSRALVSGGFFFFCVREEVDGIGFPVV